MTPLSRSTAGGLGWRGIGLVAITYVYFLIFAQFAFLKRLDQLHIADAHLKLVMAAMASAGILFSLATPRLETWRNPATRLRFAFALCGAASLLSLLPLQLVGGVGVALLIGGGLGLLTVTLVAHLPSWLGAGNQLMKVGLGTGLGYLVCNLPWLFAGSPQAQASTAAALCLAGVVFTFGDVAEEREETSAETPSFALVLAGFTALVWLDSAAFFIIQSTPALKSGTWEGSLHLWLNGLLHLVAALASAWLLRQRGLSWVLSAAFLALACACLLLLDLDRVLLASIFYPVGVSLYSVALVAYPSLLAPAASSVERARRAGWIYAVAGWMGSALGIGMGQNLRHVPAAFVAVAGVLVLAPQLASWLRYRLREAGAVLAVLLLAFGVEHVIVATRKAGNGATHAARGRQVYIAEGCIQCHSQYVRPGSADVAMWGPVQTVEELRREQPPLIGNRRQGPDLAEVGVRRSALWMKMHFYDPAEVSHTSFMPSYAELFRSGERGADLVAYLQSLQGAGATAHLQQEQAWRLPLVSFAEASASDGQRLFERNCATCHAANGRTRQRWQQSFKRLPPDLAAGPLLHVPIMSSREARQARLAQIVKYGIPGTDMPGHEYLPDAEIASLTLWLQQITATPLNDSTIQHPTGEQP